MYFERLRKETRSAFKELLLRPDITELPGINNPVKKNKGFITIFVCCKGVVHECYVDNSDINKISLNCTWVASGRKNRDELYAVCGVNGGAIMHRLLLGDLENGVTDHIDGNGLNNRRSNLIDTTQAMNLFKKGAYKNNPSGERNINYNGKYYTVNLRYRFNDLETAIEARDRCKELIKPIVDKSARRAAYVRTKNERDLTYGNVGTETNANIANGS